MPHCRNRIHVATLPVRDQRKLLNKLSERLSTAQPRKTTPSLHDRMKDLYGIVDSGIPDIATNKEHMEGFSRWKNSVGLHVR